MAASYSGELVGPKAAALWDLLNNDNDLYGTYDLTAYNSPTFAGHPPMIYRTSANQIVVPGISVNSQGPNDPGTMATDNAVGNIDWVNPDNAKTSNDARATIGNMSGAGGGSDISYYLKATNFSFTHASTFTPTGIKVTIERQDTGAVLKPRDYRVRLIKGGVIGSFDMAEANYWKDGSDEIITYGGARAMWNESWAYTDFNASNFGVAISAFCDGVPSHFVTNLGIDHITVTTYGTTEAVSGNPWYYYAQQKAAAA